MKKIITIVLTAAMLLCIFSGCSDKKNTGPVSGEIVLELYKDKAPITVQNFIDLANEGFYDGIIFHRIVEGFMIQGGDPDGDGSGGSDETIKGEFSANGVENDLSHTRGVISMARLGNDMDSASSQFFICHADATSLDGQYAAFGKVVEGMDVVDAIATVAVEVNPSSGEKSSPVDPPVIKTVEVLEDDDTTDDIVKVKIIVGN